MSTASDALDRRSLWRSVLHRALRTGDMLAASRAWDHLRVAGAALTRDESRAGRAARRAVGHAIRDARWRHDHDVRYGFPITDVELAKLPRAPVWRSPRILAPLGALALMLAVIAFWRPGAQGTPAPAFVAPLQPAATTAPFGGRGRTEATPAPRVVPTVAPTAVAVPSLPVAGPGGAGSAANTQGNAALLPPIPAGWDRFLFRVVDQDGKPVANACVIFGTTDCGPSRAHTNASGLWWLDFPRSDALSRTWDFGFSMSGFETQRVLVEYVPGTVNVKEIILTRNKLDVGR